MHQPTQEGGIREKKTKEIINLEFVRELYKYHVQYHVYQLITNFYLTSNILQQTQK